MGFFSLRSTIHNCFLSNQFTFTSCSFSLKDDFEDVITPFHFLFTGYCHFKSFYYSFAQFLKVSKTLPCKLTFRCQPDIVLSIYHCHGQNKLLKFTEKKQTIDHCLKHNHHIKRKTNIRSRTN